MMADYRERDHEIYEFICGYWIDHGYSPTQAEIAEECELDHTEYVSRALDRLEAAEFIQRERGKIRNVRVLDDEVNFAATRSEHPDSEIVVLEEILRDLYWQRKQRERSVKQ